MLDERLARRIIGKIESAIEGRAAIADEKGIIIAGNEEMETGSFSETAFRLLKEEFEVTAAADELYIAISEKNRRAGVLIIAGGGKALLPAAPGFKIIADTVMEYEGSKDDSYTRERLLDAILFESGEKMGRIENEAARLGITEELVRIPVLLDMKAERRQISSLYRLMETNHYLLKQDLMTINDDGQIIIFKTVDCDEKQLMQDYKYAIGRSLTGFFQYLRKSGVSYSLYFGPIQCFFRHYRQGYDFCIWMMRRMGGQEGSFYFYDHVVKYMQYEVSMGQMDAIFLALKEMLDEKFMERYMETMGALIDWNYNLVKASESLNIHKNTLIYRLDKIREVFNMKPLNINSDREFMECFYLYNNRIRSPKIR